MGRLVLVLVSFGLVLGVGEVVLRGRAERNDAVLRGGGLKYRFNPYERDRELSYVLRPDWETVHATADFSVHVRTNQLGLRGEGAQLQKDPESFRILVVGDSYAFGFGVEDGESFPARLGTLLTERLDRRVEVLNAGVPGWASDQYMLYLRKRGLMLEPDLVLVAIMQNDVLDLAWHRIRFDDVGLPSQIESTRHAIDHHGRLRWLEGDTIADIPVPRSDWFAENSQLYHWIRFRLVRLWMQYSERSTLESRGAAHQPTPSGPIEELSPDEIQRGLESSPEFRLRYHRRLITAIENDSAERGIPLRFILIGHSGEDFERMREDCAAIADSCLDTSSLFAEAPDEGLSFPNDGHWTPLGHDRAARAISDWLLRTQPLSAMLSSSQP